MTLIMNRPKYYVPEWQRATAVCKHHRLHMCQQCPALLTSCISRVCQAPCKSVQHWLGETATWQHDTAAATMQYALLVCSSTQCMGWRQMGGKQCIALFPYLVIYMLYGPTCLFINPVYGMKADRWKLAHGPCIKLHCKYIIFMFLGLRISTGCVYKSKKYNKGLSLFYRYMWVYHI